MQFSESWLRSLCNPPLDTESLCHVLTMAGLEVEDIQPVAAAFSHVVVAQILSAEKHPDADKLKLCSVDAGQGAPLQIVCGAPNAAVGMKIPCALVGAKLPGIEIRKAKVRGIESFGMLCSARELGLPDDQGGLLSLPADATVGMDIRSFLDLDDHLITLKLTPNRADCLSVTGIARELAALTGAPLNALPVTDFSAEHQNSHADSHAGARTVILDAPEACPRYCGRVIRGVDGRALTPEWMRRRIERSGIRCISVLVDVTNYVMLELGQPLHAFDNSQLSGAIHVRYPHPGETLQLLNGQSVQPSAETALIADEARALALAGVMGGEGSGVTEATVDLFLESAFFSPAAIAGKARSFGFSTDASHRYERGVDFDLPRIAIERASQLILDICGGQAGSVVEANSATHLPLRRPVQLRLARVTRVLGVSFDPERVESILCGLGLAVHRVGDTFEVTPPSFRFDIEIEEDLIEEIARVHGYDNIPSQPPIARTAMMPAPEICRTPMHVRRLVAERDYHEVINFSFVEPAWETDFSGNTQPIVLANPIASQMGVMRSSLIGGLVGVLITNRKRQAERVRVFELGRCFQRTAVGGPVAGFAQPMRVGGLAAGPSEPEQWAITSRRVDFYDVKADIETLFAPMQPEFVKCEHPALHPGRSASIRIDGLPVGVIGELHPRWVQKYELVAAPVVFEIELPALLGLPFPSYVEVSRFPAVVRDLALVLPQQQALGPLLEALTALCPPIVRELKFFDLYQGKGLNENEKSLAFRIVMQDTQRTLEDAEVETVVASLLSRATRDFGASLRG